MMVSVGVGLVVAGVAVVLLRLLLDEAQRRAPRQTVPLTLATVVGALVAADLIRDDAGFVATTAMGMALANQRRIDVSLMLEFQQTLVQLLVGALFILIAASVAPSDVEAVLPEALALVAVMALLVRPAAVALATWRSPLALRERAFVAWMAPRGIVAGASAWPAPRAPSRSSSAATGGRSRWRRRSGARASTYGSGPGTPTSRRRRAPPASRPIAA
jgi:NhaP-type Na+/H+ or K+/H+ antiporter